MSSKQTQQLRVVMIGDAGVGKSSLLKRYCDDTFEAKFFGCIEVDFRMKTINIKQQPHKFIIWDTAGVERFRRLPPAHYRGAVGVFLVYDVSDARSFENVKIWLEDIEKYARPDCAKILIGNKSDLDGKREVTFSKAQEFAINNDLPLFETSCKDNVNVTEAFMNMAEECLKVPEINAPKPIEPEIILEDNSWWRFCSVM